MVARSRQVFPICRRCFWTPYDLVFKNPQGSDVDFEVAEPQEVNQDAALIGPGVAEMPDVDPIRNNGCRRGKSAYRHRRECDGIDVHQPSCDFASFANKILVMTTLEVYTDSVEAVGASKGKLMLEGQWRLTSLHRVTR